MRGVTLAVVLVLCVSVFFTAQALPFDKAEVDIAEGFNRLGRGLGSAIRYTVEYLIPVSYVRNGGSGITAFFDTCQGKLRTLRQYGQELDVLVAYLYLIADSPMLASASLIEWMNFDTATPTLFDIRGAAIGAAAHYESMQQETSATIASLEGVIAKVTPFVNDRLLRVGAAAKLRREGVNLSPDNLNALARAR